MIDRSLQAPADGFSRRALWLFAAGGLLALAVVLAAPVAFMRGLGAVALACALLGAAMNALALRSTRLAPGWQVGEAPVAHEPATAAREPFAAFAGGSSAFAPLPRGGRVEPVRRAAGRTTAPARTAPFPVRVPGRLTSHA